MDIVITNSYDLRNDIKMAGGGKFNTELKGWVVSRAVYDKIEGRAKDYSWGMSTRKAFNKCRAFIFSDNKPGEMIKDAGNLF